MDSTALQAACDRITQLPCFTDPTDVQALSGGITNVNLRVTDRDRRFVVRLGADIPEHGVMRWNELALSLAAQSAGVSPAVEYHEPGVLVLEFLEAHTFDEADVRQANNLSRTVALLKTAHRTLPDFLNSPVLTFWPFQVARVYIRQLHADQSDYVSLLPDLLSDLSTLEAAVGPVTLVVGHGDMLAANILDDGTRLWFIDWEYGGYCSPLFDLAGLAGNNGLSEEQEHSMLEDYFEESPTHHWRAYQAMKCTSLLRETLWSMTAELHSQINFDYAAYTAENRARLADAMRDFRQL